MALNGANALSEEDRMRALRKFLQEEGLTQTKYESQQYSVVVMSKTVSTYLLCSGASWVCEEVCSSKYSFLVQSFLNARETNRVLKEEECSNSSDNEGRISTTGKSVLNTSKGNTGNTKSSGKPFSCEICHKGFTRKRNVKVHQRLHSGVKPYTCLTCDKSFATKSALNDHQYSHTNEATFKCAQCEKSFRQRCSLSHHVAKVHDAVKHGCRFCGKEFVKLSTLKKHEALHTNIPKSFKCDKCFKCYDTQSALKAHDFSHTGVSQHYCEICGINFATSSSLNKHVRNVHGKKKDPLRWHCEKCKRGFSLQRDLVKHTTYHCYYTALETLKAQRFGVAKISG